MAEHRARIPEKQVFEENPSAAQHSPKLFQALRSDRVGQEGDHTIAKKPAGGEISRETS
jgi:hypothetical protein